MSSFFDLRKSEQKDFSNDDFFSVDALSEGDHVLNELYEGQLNIDIYKSGNELIIIAAMAGVKPKSLDIFIDNDMLTIRGKRALRNLQGDEEFFFQECYWGTFSRSILLPVAVNAHAINATLEDGILTVRFPVIEQRQKIKVNVKK
jgi:HSP20 family protein